MRVRKDLVSSALGAIAAVALLGGCSFEASVGSRSIDQTEVEQVMSDGLEDLVGVAPQSVDCTGIEDLELEEGNTFTCTGTAPAGGEFDINMTLTDDEGKFTFEVPE